MLDFGRSHKGLVESSQCKRDYEKEIKYLTERITRRSNFLHILSEFVTFESNWFDQETLKAALTMIGALNIEIPNMENEKDSLIELAEKEQRDAT